AAVVATAGFARAGQAAKVERLASGANGLGDLVLRLHQERTLSLQVVSGTANGNKVNELKLAQVATNVALLETRNFVNSLDLSSLSQEAVAAVGASEAAHNKLPEVRADIQSGHAQADQVAARFDSMIALDVALPQRIGDSLSNRQIGRSLAAYSNLANLVELASQEAEIGAAVIAAGGADPQSAVQLSSLQGLQNEAVQQFRLNATKAQADALDTALYQPIDERAAFTSQRLDIVASLSGSKLATSQGDWIKSATARVNAIRQQLEPIAGSTAKFAAASSADARRQAVLLLAAGLTLVALLIGLGLVLARAMTRPLRRLTVTAGEVAEELPKMVERMATPGEGPGVQMPEIEVNSRDEVGQLALAFKNVNDTTVRVAEEQAALRASIAEMFVNVARRNHVLLSRQLSFIDQLERTEENPDTLDNLFRLDHLATRMRRNAESLIVLAGIDAGRRLRRPMPLSDVIRTAVSEIERYDRVDLALQADPPMVGHVALTTAHMIAELLENATQFSNPDTRVVTSTAFSSSGVRITITDLGLGMTWDEITEANQRIAAPPATEVVGSQRLGFYVVGRLARRLDATVALRPGRTQGTVVTIDLPPALFVAGTVADLPTVEVDAAPVETTPQSAPAAPVEPSEAAPSVDSAPVTPVEPVTPVVPVIPVVPAAGEAPSSLPRRGQAADAPVDAPVDAAADAPATARVEPRVPVLPAPADGDTADGASLPKRVRDAAAPVAAEAPAPAAPEGPRSGIFSSFRSRRDVEETVGSVPAPSFGDATPAGLDDASEGPAFVPVLEESTPALPTRSHAAPSPLDDDWQVAEVAEVAETPEVVELQDDVQDVPALAPESHLTLVEDEPAFEPSFELEPAEPAFEQAFEPTFELEPAPEPAVAVADPGVARSTLAELARETEQASADNTDNDADTDSDASTAVQPVVAEEPPVTETVPVVPALPPVGVPAMDIRPTRGGRSRLRRSKPLPTRSSAAPAPAPAPAPLPPVPVTPAPAVTSTFPVPAQPTPTEAPAPVQAAPSSLFAAPPQPSEPVAAPSSLFAQPPAAEYEPTPEPAFAPPALAAASLRERSAMASEALSELSALSSYSPQAVEAAAPTSLTRRTPLATPAGQMATRQQPEEPIGARRSARNAADVRTMLSGFRAGVERGRTSPAASAPEHHEPGA
ncbi:MAG: nitrate- and nitrite sensing domain-containing protein, partial [Angustibacter sp.]